MGCAVSAGEAGAWAKRLPPFRNVVLKLRQRLENISETNGLSLRALLGEAGLVSPSAASSPPGGSLLALCSTPGVYSPGPRGANRPLPGLEALGRERFQTFGGCNLLKPTLQMTLHIPKSS